MGGITFKYSSPEVLKDVLLKSKSNFSSDIYSLGCVLNLLFTGN